MQGTGNDFLIVEAGDEERDWGAPAAAMCERNYGVGAHGLMLVLPSEGADAWGAVLPLRRVNRGL